MNRWVYYFCITFALVILPSGVSLSLKLDGINNQAEVEQKSTPNEVNHQKSPDGTDRGEGSVLFILTKGQFQAVLNPDKPK